MNNLSHIEVKNLELYAALNGIKVNYKTDIIQTIIPHRAPFNLIDSIEEIDLEKNIVACKRKVDAHDPVFKGHFPGKSIYPGVLQIEIMGQTGLCLFYFFKHNSLNVYETFKAINGYLTRILNATFYYPVYPNDSLVVYAKLLEENSLKGTMFGQIYNQKKTLCSSAILEFIFE